MQNYSVVKMSEEALYKKQIVIMPSTNKKQYEAPLSVIQFLFNLNKNTLKYKKTDNENETRSKVIGNVEIGKFDYNPIHLLAILSRHAEIISVNPFIGSESKSKMIPKGVTVDTMCLNNNISYSLVVSITLHSVRYIFHINLCGYRDLWSLKNAASMEAAGKILVLQASNIYGDLTRDRDRTETPSQYTKDIKTTKENLKLLAEVLLDRVPMALHTDHASDLIDLIADKKIVSPTIPGIDNPPVDPFGILNELKLNNPWNIHERKDANSKVITITHDQLPIIGFPFKYSSRKPASTGDLHERVGSPILPLPLPTAPPPLRTVPIDSFIKKQKPYYNRRGYRPQQKN